MNRTIGRFDISLDSIEHEQETVRKMLDGIIIVEAEYNYSTLYIEYTGNHPSFDIVPTGSAAPLYQWKDGWKRVPDAMDERVIQHLAERIYELEIGSIFGDYEVNVPSIIKEAKDAVI